LLSIALYRFDRSILAHCPQLFIIMPADTVTRTLRAKVRREQIVFLNHLLDTYDNLGLMRTVKMDEGLVEFWVPDSRWPTFRELIDELARDHGLTLLDEGVWSPETNKI
jgi:hypothetical protein